LLAFLSCFSFSNAQTTFQANGNGGF